MNSDQMIRARSNALEVANEMSMLIGFERANVDARSVVAEMSMERAVDALETAAKAMGFRLVPVASSTPSLIAAE